MVNGAGVAVEAHEVRERLRHAPEVVEALDRMGPGLAPAQLLNDRYGARALVDRAAGNLLSEEERRALHRKRAGSIDEVTWTVDAVPLLDDARPPLGPQPRRRSHGPRAHYEVTTSAPPVGHDANNLPPIHLRPFSQPSLTVRPNDASHHPPPPHQT